MKWHQRSTTSNLEICFTTCWSELLPILSFQCFFLEWMGSHMFPTCPTFLKCQHLKLGPWRLLEPQWRSCRRTSKLLGWWIFNSQGVPRSLLWWWGRYYWLKFLRVVEYDFGISYEQSYHENKVCALCLHIVLFWILLLLKKVKTLDLSLWPPEQGCIILGMQRIQAAKSC